MEPVLCLFSCRVACDAVMMPASFLCLNIHMT
jgi:hypothetical protein